VQSGREREENERDSQDSDPRRVARAATVARSHRPGGGRRESGHPLAEKNNNLIRSGALAVALGLRECDSVSAAPKIGECAVGEPKARVDGIGNGVPGPRAAVARQAGPETLGEWMDRHSLSRAEVASRLTAELGKTISAKAVALNRNWPIPSSWCEALARSEHAPPEAEPHSERDPIRERAEIKGELSTHERPSLHVGRPAHPSLAFSWLAGFLRSDDFWWGLAASILSVLLGLVIALSV
jgi:hypothetical protein